MFRVCATLTGSVLVLMVATTGPALAATADRPAPAAVSDDSMVWD